MGFSHNFFGKIIKQDGILIVQCTDKNITLLFEPRALLTPKLTLNMQKVPNYKQAESHKIILSIIRTVQ